MAADTIQTRVDRGVALLDKTLADWDERIDLDKLDLANTCNCILGQEFAGHPDAYENGYGYPTPFDIGLNEMFMDSDQAAENGFDISSDIADQDTSSDEFAALTDEWRRVILARRGGK